MNNLFDNLQFKVYTDILKKSKKDGKRLIRGYASTAALDRQNEVISMEALRRAANDLLENHTVFYEHEHQKFPVGKVTETGIDDKGLEVVVEISQTADQLWTLIEEDILDSFSIGGRVTSSEEKVGKDNKPYNEVTGIELFEVSVVGLPANPEAKFALVNKSFNMAITDEIKKRKEGKEMDEKKIETISSDTTNAKAVTVATDNNKTIATDGTSDVVEIVEPKAEEKKVVEEKKEEPTKVEKKEDSKVVEEEDAQKKDLAKYEAEDKAKASEKPKEEKDTTEKSQEAKPEEIVAEEKEVVVVEEKPVEEKVEEKPEIKVDNSTVTDEEFEKLVVEDISKPYPNEHAARIREPGDFQEGSFRSKPITEGVRIIIGRLKGETAATTQAYRFHIDHFTVEEAKQWLKDHEISYILFEPATKPEESSNKHEEKKEEPKVEKEEVVEPKDDDEAVFEFLIDEVENAKQQYPYYPYPYAKLGEEVKEIIFLLDKLIAKETNEDAKAIMQEIKAKISKLVGQEYPYPEKYPYPKKEEAGKQYPAPEAALKEILAGLKDLGKKIDEVISRLPEKDVEVKEPEEIKEEPKVEEKKEEPKVEKKVEETEEKPQRKSFIADAPYANDKKDEEKTEKDVKKPTQKGWSKIVYGE